MAEIESPGAAHGLDGPGQSRGPDGRILPRAADARPAAVEGGERAGSPARREPSSVTAATSGAAPPDLATMLSQLARGMEQEGDPKLTLTFVVTNAVDVVPGTQEASISLVTGRRRVRAEVPAGPMCTAIDTIQTETGEGPCLDAAFVDEVVRVPDVVAETRWLDFSRRAAAAGVGSMLVFRLFVREDTLGALVLASARPYGFDEESEHVGSLLAVHAALALGGAQQQQQLQAGLSSRDVIGQAKGILMERYGLTGEVAFSLLVRVSRTANRKLRDVCDELIATRELAGQPRQAKAEA